MNASTRRVRLGAIALAVAAVLFVLYPATRPWHDESTPDGALAAMGSSWWEPSHIFAMLGFVLVALGLLALRTVVGGTRAEPVAAAAVATTWIGAGLTLPYYGAEAFALHALAVETGETAGEDFLDLVDAVRFGPLAVTTFALGLLLMAVGAMLAAVAVWRSGVLPRYGGVVFALGYVLFMPQFFGPPAVRIAHGLLVGIGAVWLAVLVARTATRQRGVPTAG